MAFWDWFKKGKDEPSSADISVKADRRPEEGGKLRGGKKHGPWVEREECEDTRWNAATGKFDKLGTYGWRELVYVDGVKQGPFVWRSANGVARRIGTYVADKIDGHLEIRHTDGTIAGEGGFRTDQLHGHWVQRHASGNVDYESDYVDGKRNGPWKMCHEDGKPLEEGAHELGERVGPWSIWSKAGTLIEQGTYVAGKRHGAWKLRRDDGSICAEGEYDAGAMRGPWRAVSPDGVAGPPRTCVDETELARWTELETAVGLVSTYEPTHAWVERTKTAFAVLAKPWQVTSQTDSLGQRSLSAPLDAAWQLRVAVGVPMHECCYDEVWSRIVGALDDLPAAAREEAVALVEGIGKRYPSYIPRDWLTAILDDEVDDPRARLAERFEPGREFDAERSQRFQRRVPHAVELSLRECEFPGGFDALFERGYPDLERLLVVRSDSDDIPALYELLARATWPTHLVQLAIIESGEGPSDEQLGALLANPHLGALKFLTIDGATLGAATTRALRDGAAAKSLESIDLRNSTLDVGAITAIAACPKLDELELRDCELPDMTSRQAMAIDSPSLKTLKLSGTLGVERYAHGDERSGYAVARRLAVMPAVGKLEVLDLSSNELDELAARVLARSPFVRTLKVLEWAGNAEDDDEIAELRASLGEGKLGLERATRGNVVVLQL